MTIENISYYLDKFNYDYTIKNNSVIVNLGYNQIISVDISENHSIIIKDELKGWNPLTGLIVMSFKKVMAYNTIGLILIFAFFLFFNVKKEVSMFYTAVPIVIFSIWIIVWSLYYHIKLEFFKHFLLKIFMECERN